MKKFCVCFAGVPGCDKSPLAVRLSWEFGLPVFSNDMIRREVRIENNGALDRQLYDKRQSLYLNNLLSKQRSFIYDASVDRKWAEFKERANQEAYQLFVISFDLSPAFVSRLGKSANSLIEKDAMEVYFKQHDNFLSKFRSDVNVHINDENFTNRFNISIAALDEWLA